MIDATLVEKGNGFPDIGDYVPGTDGLLYRVGWISGDIRQPQRSGGSNWMLGRVVLADWADCPEEDVFQCVALIEET